MDKVLLNDTYNRAIDDWSILYAEECMTNDWYHLIRPLSPEDNEKKVFIMYDIVCLIEKRLKEELPELRESNAFLALSVFHAFAHNSECQMHYNPQFLEGFGRTTGETMEAFWSYANKFVSSTRKMTAGNRHMHLTDATRYWNLLKTENTANVILKNVDDIHNQLRSLEHSHRIDIEAANWQVLKEEMRKKKEEYGNLRNLDQAAREAAVQRMEAEPEVAYFLDLIGLHELK
ncbi:hypothetical protein MBANPS3_012603 [Mucor bainieri]